MTATALDRETNTLLRKLFQLETEEQQRLVPVLLGVITGFQAGCDMGKVQTTK